MKKFIIGRSTSGIISSTIDFLKTKWRLERQGLKLQDIQFLKTSSIEGPRLDSSYDVSQAKLKSIEFSKRCTTENVETMQGAEALLIESHDKAIIGLRYEKMQQGTYDIVMLVKNTQV